MTPAQTKALAVALDGLREAGLDAVQVVTDGHVFAIEEHVQWEGETLIAICPTESAARAFAASWWRARYAEPGPPELVFGWNAHRNRLVSAADRGEIWISRMPLVAEVSRPESGAGASTPQPVMETCAYCGGTGEVDRGVDQDGVDYSDECPECEGSGEHPVPGTPPAPVAGNGPSEGS